MVILVLAGFATDASAESALASQDLQARASFDLVVQKSQVLKLGATRLETQSAFVTYTNEFFAGRTNALKIQFFTQPIGAEAQVKLLKRDDREMGKNGYAGLVLFLDARDQITQANLTFVVPGTTVVRDGCIESRGIGPLYLRLPLRSKPAAAEEPRDIQLRREG